jgi:hypothetical protein
MRHLNTIKIVGLALLVVFLVGCKTAPIYNVDNAPVSTASDGQPTMKQVEQAIVRAGTSLGWRMEPVREGLIEATLINRGHMAKVEIDYTTSSYSINYKDSKGLDYNGDEIHKGYNKWIQNLDQRIRSRLISI